MADNLMQTRFGSREICNVVFKAKSQKKIGNKTFEKVPQLPYMLLAVEEIAV